MYLYLYISPLHSLQIHTYAHCFTTHLVMTLFFMSSCIFYTACIMHMFFLQVKIKCHFFDVDIHQSISLSSLGIQLD